MGGFGSILTANKVPLVRGPLLLSALLAKASSQYLKHLAIILVA
jgi:hypothetical protein